MTWGTNLVGFGSVLAALDGLKVQYSGNATYVVGTNVRYAVYVEFGTAHTPAQPYLLPAAREVARDAESYVAEHVTLEGAIEAMALDIERGAKQRVPVDTGNLKGSIRAERIR